jgi:hypothetical protein
LRSAPSRCRKCSNIHPRWQAMGASCVQINPRSTSLRSLSTPFYRNEAIWRTYSNSFWFRRKFWSPQVTQ